MKALLLLMAVTAQAATVTLNVSCFAGLVHDAGTSDCSAVDTTGASASGSASASALTLGAWQASVGITAHMGQSWAGGAGAAAITAHFGTVGEIRQGWFALTTDIQGSADIDSHYQGDVYVADRHFQYTGGGFGPSGGIPLHWQQFPLTLGVLNPFALNVSAMASPGPYLHPTSSTTFTVGLRVYEADGVTPVAFNASPEPGTWILIGVGLLGLIVKRRKCNRRPEGRRRIYTAGEGKRRESVAREDAKEPANQQDGDHRAQPDARASAGPVVGVPHVAKSPAE